MPYVLIPNGNGSFHRTVSGQCQRCSEEASLQFQGHFPWKTKSARPSLPISSIILGLCSDIPPVKAQCAAPSISSPSPNSTPLHAFLLLPSPLPPKSEGIFSHPSQLFFLLSSISNARQYLCLVNLHFDLSPPSPPGSALSILLLFPVGSFSDALRQKRISFAR